MFGEKGAKGLTDAEAPLEGILAFTFHMMQGTRSGDYHAHQEREQVYYFLRGKGTMKIDDQLYAVAEGDSLHIPARCRHQLINDSDDWIEHLIITAKAGQPEDGGRITKRNWRDCTPVVAHESVIGWVIFKAKGTAGFPAEQTPLEGFLGMALQTMQAGRKTDYHAHEEREQVYYFTKGRGRMKLDGDVHEVKAGDAVHIPPQSKHQTINDSDDWLEHLILSAAVER